MAGETAWLEGNIIWQSGRVAWESDRGTVTPSAHELAIAQRRLSQVAGFPHASAQALGDAQAWLSRRMSRLELAKYFTSIYVPDLESVARRARAGGIEEVRKLVPLLAVEALCVSGLPASPGAALVGAGRQAEASLLQYLTARDVSLSGQALSALMLGAIYRQGGDPSTRPEMPTTRSGSEWLRRAYDYGLKLGFPSDPAIILGLLAAEDGAKLARRYAAIERAPGPFALPASTLREMLFAGISALALLETAEALQAAASLAERIMDYREELPELTAYKRGKRYETANRLRDERKHIVDDLAEVIHSYVKIAPQPEVVYGIARFCNVALEMAAPSPTLGLYICNQLRAGLSVPTRVLSLYLELIATKQEEWRNKDEWPNWMKSLSFSNALGNMEGWFGKSTAQVLQNCSEGEIVRQALELDAEYVLRDNKWDDYELYRWALSLIRELDLRQLSWLGGKLCYMLGIFPTARAARAALQPFFAYILQAEKDLRVDLCIRLLDDIDMNRKSVAQSMPRLTRYVPSLIAFIKAHYQGDALQDYGCFLFVAPLSRVALALDSTLPDKAETEAWLGWFMQHIISLSGKLEHTWEQAQAVKLGGLLALAVSGGDRQRFQTVAQAAIQFEYDYQVQVLEDTIANLGRFPGLHTPIVRMFRRQPRRCVELIVRLGLAQRLGPHAIQPVFKLNEDAGDIDLQAEEAASEWKPLLEIAPALDDLVKEYIQAQRIKGEATCLPPGVREILSQRSKLENELAFIEAKLQVQPERADLTSRAGSLRERLADDDTLTRSIAEEAGERLEQVTGEAQLTAAKHLVMSCYRNHLNAVAGPVPDDMPLDENMLNAILLTVDIKRNKRLLRSLLRAYIRGDRDWPRSESANMRFLEGLQTRGVDVAAWLGRHPRRYACKGAHGGYVRLSLERDPLHVLQMGNHFDTCLSFGGINAFSTVANATELNKRVIYARDGKGRVVGRKLIAINDKGGLVGFRTYTSLDWDKGGKQLNDIFLRYVTTLAELCHLEMQNEGTIPTLLARHWYDDGIVNWNEDVDPPTASPASRSRAPRPSTRTSRVRHVSRSLV
ncbi:MAG TPA: hypothetical protein VF952_02820 [Chloroflexia bacterium]|jgi:hypothetical protein